MLGLFRLTQEQSVTGLVTAGLELVEGVNIDKIELLPFFTEYWILSKGILP